MKVDDSEILTIECPYTSCAAGVGTVCTNARNGKPMPHSHKDRLRAWADRENRLANAGHEIAMSYNAWQIVRLVACSMVCDLDADQPEGWSEAREAIHRLLDELPCLNWGNPVATRRGRVQIVRPKHHRQRFNGSLLATLKIGHGSLARWTGQKRLVDCPFKMRQILRTHRTPLRRLPNRVLTEPAQRGQRAE